MAAFPVMRNPMVLAGVPPGFAAAAGAWTWPAVAAAAKRLGRSVATVGFLIDTLLYPTAKEAACAMVAGEGGSLGAVTPGSCTPTFALAPGAAATRALVGMLAATGQPPPSWSGLGMRPSYLWDGLWGRRRRCWNCLSGVQAFPGGSARAAAPCMYLCASVFRTTLHLALAQDFCRLLHRCSLRLTA